MSDAPAPAPSIRRDGTVLGFDVGARRIGVAVGSAFGHGARALAVIDVHGDQIDWPAIDPLGPRARAVSALTLDAAGRIYLASTLDPGEHGPFRSVVWRIGVLTAGTDGRPQVRLGPAERIATLDGCKVESLALRLLPDGGAQLFAGTDDEHYGGILRPLPAVP